MKEINPLNISLDSKIVERQRLAKIQLDIKTHAVMSLADRPDKKIEVPVDVEEGEEPQSKTKEVPVNRISVPFQKLIVKMRLAFMNVKNIKVVADPKEDSDEERLVEFVNKIRDDNKLRYKEVQCAKALLQDLQSAKLYYFEDTKKNNYPNINKGTSKLRMRMKLLAPSLGDTLIPILDQYGTMKMFIRKYISEAGDTMTEVFTDDVINVYTESVLTDSSPNEFGKIPICYYSLNETIWGDVQPMIDRLETLLSNFSDTIDYNGSPIMTASGEIEGFSTKGERGKVFQLSDGAELDYLTWDSAPEAIKLELDTLKELIFSCSQTPNISLENMKGLGGMTGVGMDRVFLSATLAANDIIDSGYGESAQRDINLQKAGAVFIDPSLESVQDIDIWFELEAYRFNDIEAQIETLVKAVQGGVLSVKSGVMNNPLVEGNGKAEYDQILEEAGALSIQQAEEEQDV